MSEASSHLKSMCLCFLIAELHRYQLRAYLFQARNVFAGDDSGFSGT